MSGGGDRETGYPGGQDGPSPGETGPLGSKGLRSLIRVFISYARVNRPIVKDWVVDILVDAGYDVWFDDRLVPGLNWKQELNDRIQQCDVFIFCMTPQSITSEWCQHELAMARELGKPIIPVLLQAGTPQFEPLRSIQHVDFTHGATGSAVARLIGGVQQIVYAKLVVDEDVVVRQRLAQLENERDVVSSVGRTEQHRRLEAAMPACTQIGTDSKLKVKISLPDSAGLRAELPEILPSGDSIQQGDVRSNTLYLRFPIDTETGKLLPGTVCLEIKSADFNVIALSTQTGSCAGGGHELRVPPTDDSRTLNFSLIPKSADQKPGLSTVYIRVLQDGKEICDHYVETRFVESMDTLPICGDWYLRVRTLNFTGDPSLIDKEHTVNRSIDGDTTAVFAKRMRISNRARVMQVLRDPAFQAVVAVITLILAIIGIMATDRNSRVVDDEPSPQFTGEPTTGALIQNPSETPGPTSIPSPSPTSIETPEPTVTLTPTHVFSPTPTYTSTPYVLDFILVESPVPEDFSIELRDHRLAQLLGLANTEAAVHEDLGAYLELQYGVMFWLGIFTPEQRIFVLFPDGTYRIYPDTWDGKALNLTVPDGFYAPVNGFGQLWRDNDMVRERLGYPTMCEVAVNMTFQTFSRGMLLRMYDQYHFTSFDCQVASNYIGKTYALFNEGGNAYWVLLHD